LLRNKVADFLAANGFVEMLSNSLTRSAYYTEEELKHAVKLLNPLSADLDIMRMDMMWNGLEMLQYNRNRKVNDVKAFEFGNIYHTTEGKYTEQQQLAIYLTGNKTPEGWQGEAASSTFFQLKSVVQQVLQKAGIRAEASISQGDASRITPAFDVKLNKLQLGKLGIVDTAITSRFDIEQPVYYAVLDWKNVLQAAAEEKFVLQMPSPFPAVRRDLALLLDEAVTYQQIHDAIVGVNSPLIREINIFDVYRGDKLEAGKKSYAISMMLQHDDKTLTDEETDALVQKVIKRLNEATGALLRQ
jgi:phenylalanyl-tRNA synthetase beta chain